MARRFQSLSFKVIATFILLTVLSIAVIDVLAYFASSRISDEQALKAKESVLIFRGDMLQDQLTQLENQANSIARIEALQMSITNLKSGWKTIEKTAGDARAELKKVFIAGNPNPADQREKLIKPEGPSGFYYSSHEKTQGEVARDLEDTAFSDLLIVDLEGTVLYSYKKEDDFAENLKSDAWKTTGAGIAFAKAIENTAKATDDTAPTGFSGLRVDAGTGKSAIFYAVPIVKLGAAKGIILFKVRDDIVTGILAKGIVKGSTARAAIVSGDGSAIGLDGSGKLATLDATPFTFIKSALASSAMTVADFDRADGAARAYVRGIDYRGDRFLVVESVLLSELNAGSIEIATLLTMIGIGVLVFMAIATGLVTNLLFSPLARLAGVTRDVADGKLDSEIGSLNRKDEIGTMANALDRFRHSLIESRELEAASEETRLQAEQDRQQNLAEREAEAKTLQQVVEAIDEGLHHLANGDLAYQIDTRFPNELESLRVNFNEALATLSETMTAIGGNSMAVRAGSEEMRTGADELAGRTERQAGSITETANAISAITQSVRRQIERAEQAERIARDAKKETTGSGQIMRETIAAMEAIQASSRQINTIISVIDDIAFQTNLLALNAGVEAARAGESGKGFAVVAMEVRELAQRSSSAAKEISSLLQKSTHEVESGVTLVEKAGVALTGIGAHVEAINGQINEIMSATREEANTLREINSAVAELDAMTQQNASMVEETTAAIHRLATEALEMDRQLGNFTLPPGHHQPSAEVHVLRRHR
ncbi:MULTISPECIES: methyl-accepting chemotaxis protein [Rhizobium]|uniref:methyl-accepting chemotaxis protein n=1 Tax=Rhizobium TaxID=379 RepID=UPI001C90F46D|nr:MULTISPECIES: methyl-accepting chemotaxis protein [Rhizobium]MBY3197773.1 methyl-accepting chemotaxis protein [Rhizobium laguerreae]MBY3369316.1 methyl-accepting chemotaxis protein [Rhizobium laguerreae]MBY3390160.1 methyl-accepting chemotaxis protein [Rhizobium laguerreae]MBY3403823.1 methyl-accepting chemotaxis protein [Rhizobium laguerreae]MBY3410762.1 methyl-accepting chemotaxis protein [Rhizobium laguerreae]